jgi:WD40 repeat protein
LTTSGEIARRYSRRAVPDGRWVLSGSADGKVRLWEVSSGKEIKCFDGHQDAEGYRKAVNSVAFPPDGRYGLSGGDDKWVRLWAIPRSPHR